MRAVLTTAQRPRARRVLALALALPLLLGALSRPDRASVPQAVEQACELGSPHFVTACYFGLNRANSNQVYEPAAVSVAMFTNTANNRPHYRLANYDDVGTVWGLAYSHVEEAVYASAYHKRQLPYGPLGPGGIYRIDLKSGVVTPLTTVPNAGADVILHEDPIRRTDDVAEPLVGRVSLGDLELSAENELLFVVNMSDGAIYRYALPGGQLLGRFPHGASDERWADEARPMALAWHDGWLYHGVTRTGERSRSRSALYGYIYRSRPDGSAMERVAEIPLDYERGFIRPSPYSAGSLPVDWQYWRDGFIGFSRTELEVSAYPQPMLSDITFDARGDMTVGFRDRRMDTSPRVVEMSQVSGWRAAKGNLLQAGFSIGVGDLLHGRQTDDQWWFSLHPTHYSDSSAALGDQSAHGGLAQLPTGNEVVAGAYANNSYQQRLYYSEGFHWYDTPSGEKREKELVCDPVRFQPYDPPQVVVAPAEAHSERPPPPLTPEPGTPPPEDMTFVAPSSVGDVEAICGPQVPPTATATPSPSPSPSATPTVTPRPTRGPLPEPSRVPSATPTPRGRTVHLPLAVRNAVCVPVSPRADVVLVLDASTSMLNRTAVGKTRLAALKAAVGETLDLLALGFGDRVALVTFNDVNMLLAELTDDRDLLSTALDTLHPDALRPGTRMQLGLNLAAKVFEAREPADTRHKIVVLVTDGVNTDPPSVAVRAADALKTDGSYVFTIGIGEDGAIDARLLEEMASAPEAFHHVRSAEDLAPTLEEVYIALRGLPCP